MGCSYLTTTICSIKADPYPEHTSVSQYGNPVSTLTQLSSQVPSFGCELNKYVHQTRRRSSSFGLAYLFNETFYSFYSEAKTLKTGNNNEFTRVIQSGNCALKNHRIRVIYGFNFYLGKACKITLQPFNLELRVIDGRTKIRQETYEGISSKIFPGYYTTPRDSIVTLTASQTKDYNFTDHGPAFTLAFPTTAAFEYVFKLRERYGLAGLSTSFSALGTYVYTRVFFGISLSNRRDTKK